MTVHAEKEHIETYPETYKKYAIQYRKQIKGNMPAAGFYIVWRIL